MIHSGDFTVRGSREEVQEFAEWFANQDFKYKVVIAGNHELTMDKERFEKRLVKFQNKPNQMKNLMENCDPQLFVNMLKEKENVYYLEHEPIEIMGYKIFGSPYIPPFGEWAFMLKK